MLGYSQTKYISYGRLEKAAELLERAISNEPQKTHHRLMLLGVYAEIKDKEAFLGQYAQKKDSFLVHNGETGNQRKAKKWR